MSSTPPLPHRDLHEEVRLLLPWYAEGRLDAGEQARVAAHLAECGPCAREAAASDLISDALRRNRLDADAAWAALLPRLDPAPAPTVVPFARRLRVLAAPALLAAGVAFGVLVAPGLAPSLAPAPAAETYRGLGDAAAAPGNALLVFAPGASEAEVRAALRAAGATIVGGPTAADAWVVRIPREGFETRLAGLQAERSVRLAHALEPPPQ